MSIASKPIPTSQPVLNGNERKYLLDCLKRNWISFGGKYTQEFEKNFADFLGVKYALSCSSGTAALHLALVALGIGSGDEVIIPNFTIISSASTVIWTGAKPVLVDVDQYFCIDPSKIEEKITKKTKAIMVVHMYGNPANMDKIQTIAKKYHLFIIEDSCMAHGAMVGSKKVGSIGGIGCFSFYASKNITCGEGGMVVTSNRKIAKKIKLFRNYAEEKPRFNHTVLGFNYRMTDLQAAIGLAQLERIEKIVKRKRQIAQNYRKLLKDCPEVILPKDPSWGKSVFWMFGILINSNFGISRDEIIKKLSQKGIESTRFFVPISDQPVFKKGKDIRFPDIGGIYPVSEDISSRGLYLPSGLGITYKQQEKVVSRLLSLRVR